MIRGLLIGLMSRIGVVASSLSRNILTMYGIAGLSIDIDLSSLDMNTMSKMLKTQRPRAEIMIFIIAFQLEAIKRNSSSSSVNSLSSRSLSRGV